MLGSPTREPTGSHSPSRSAGRVGSASAPGGRGWKGGVAEEKRGFAEFRQRLPLLSLPTAPGRRTGGMRGGAQGLKTGLNDSAAAGGREQDALARGLQPWRRAWWSGGGREGGKAEVGRGWKTL